MQSTLMEQIFLRQHMTTPHMKYSIRPFHAIVVFCLFCSSLSASANTLEVEAGRSYSDSRGTNTLFLENVFEPTPIGISRFSWAADVSFGWIDGRNEFNYRPGRYDVRDHAFVAAAGARFQYGNKADWYRHLFFSFQPTFNTGRTLALSSPYEFTSSLGWQTKHFSVAVRHISNGGIHDPNRGETMALLGLVF
ncbi:hypothetical protein HDE78_000451 [Rhodanobacter sp. K2T2]|nr:hypothetical protein [Rhodanobacter sp. K2T2]